MRRAQPEPSRCADAPRPARRAEPERSNAFRQQRRPHGGPIAACLVQSQSLQECSSGGRTGHLRQDAQERLSPWLTTEERSDDGHERIRLSTRQAPERPDHEPVAKAECYGPEERASHGPRTELYPHHARGECDGHKHTASQQLSDTLP